MEQQSVIFSGILFFHKLLYKYADDESHDRKSINLLLLT